MVLNTLPFLTKHYNIGATETIDRLLGIANEKEATPVPVQLGQEVPLAAVGVLKFVDQNRLELALPSPTNRGMPLQEIERTLFEVELGNSERRQQLFNAYVRLYKALGGGWMTKEAMAQQETQATTP